jgi:hypothetical protein
LFSKDRCNLAERNEAAEMRPEMPRVGDAKAFAGAGEGLAGATPGADRSLVRPAGEPERERPAANAGEEVFLLIRGDFMGLDVGNRSVVHPPRREQPVRDEFAQPRAALGIVVVVIGRHQIGFPSVV